MVIAQRGARAGARKIWARPRTCALLLATLSLACAVGATYGQVPKWRAALAQFQPSGDIPEQRAALQALYAAVGGPHSRLAADSLADVVGSPGLVAWNTPNSSYCTWWGINCCGTTLTSSLPLCAHGPHSVSGLHLAATNLTGELPDTFTGLRDLQLLDLSFNRELHGPLPPSLASAQNLWLVDVTGTLMSCSGVLPKSLLEGKPQRAPSPFAACPLPDWLRFSADYNFQPDMLECPSVVFTDSRVRVDLLQRAYVGPKHGEVYVESLYFNGTNCVSAEFGPGKLAMPADPSSGIPIVVLVILVPSLAVSVGLVLLSVALMRYLRYLKRSHDAIHLTEGWKRRNPPGIISDGNDRVLREVTLVITDVEGSTELWEWDHAVMTVAQELHDSVMRELISRYCGFEVITEGDSFTIAFHDAFDAVSWALAMQQAMMEVDWPEPLLSHPKAGVVLSTITDSSRPGQLLFRGLRVRVAITTGIPTEVKVNEMTNTPTYGGPVIERATALSDLPAGGQVLLGPNTLSAIVPRLAEMGVRLLLSQESDPAAIEAKDGKGTGWFGWLTRLAPGGGHDSRPTNSLVSGASSGAGGGSGVAAGNGITGGAPGFQGWLRQLLVSRGDSMADGMLRVDTEAPASDNLKERARREASAVALGGGGDGHLPSASTDSEHVPLIIDMGSHWLDGMQALTQVNNPAALMGVRMTQIVARNLAPRAAHFPPLKTFREVYPSYFEAPFAADALLPDGVVFRSGDLPEVTIAFCAPDNVRPLEALSKRAAKEALEMFSSAVRTTLTACRGYECQEKDAIFMLAFRDPVSAIEWACVLQIALLRVRWSPDVLACPIGQEVVGPSGEVLYRGLRARVGLYRGEITRIIPHRAIGRADYFGPPVNRAARFLSAAAPGQVLADRDLAEAAMARWGMTSKGPSPRTSPRSSPKAAHPPAGHRLGSAGQNVKPLSGVAEEQPSLLSGTSAENQQQQQEKQQQEKQQQQPQQYPQQREPLQGRGRGGRPVMQLPSVGREAQKGLESFSFAAGPPAPSHDSAALPIATGPRGGSSGGRGRGGRGSGAGAGSGNGIGSANSAAEGTLSWEGGSISLGDAPSGTTNSSGGLAAPGRSGSGNDDNGSGSRAGGRGSGTMGRLPTLSASLSIAARVGSGQDASAEATAATEAEADASDQMPSPFMLGVPSTLDPADPNAVGATPRGALSIAAPPAAAASVPRPKPAEPSAARRWLGLGGGGGGDAVKRTPSAPVAPFRRGVSFSAQRGSGGGGSGNKEEDSPMDEALIGFDDAAGEADEDGGSGDGDFAAAHGGSRWLNVLTTLGSRPAPPARPQASVTFGADAGAAGPQQQQSQQQQPQQQQKRVIALGKARSRHLSFVDRDGGAAQVLRSSAAAAARPSGSDNGSAYNAAASRPRRAAGIYGLVAALKSGADGSAPGVHFSGSVHGGDASDASDGELAVEQDELLREDVARVPSVPQLPAAARERLLGRPPSGRRPSAAESEQQDGAELAAAAATASVRTGASVAPPPPTAPRPGLRAGGGAAGGFGGPLPRMPSTRGGTAGAAALAMGAANASADSAGGLPATGGLPLEALARMQLSHRLTKNNSFMLQALTGQASQQAPARVTVDVQVHAVGTWTFKGISGEHSVVQLLPSMLAERLDMVDTKKTSKAVCVHQESGLLFEAAVDMVNADAILFDPAVLEGPTASAGTGTGGGGAGGAASVGGAAGGSGGGGAGAAERSRQERSLVGGGRW